MQRHRFYAPPSRISDSHLTLDADESHHLTRVLRLAAGARVFVFDGAGSEYECEVTVVSKGAVDLTVISRLQNEVESPLHLTLGQALIKGDKFDWVVQKTTELGVTRIVPLITDHSDVYKAEGHTDHRLQRWRRIALEAVKQCGRRRLVEITEPVRFIQFCEDEKAGSNLILSERGGHSLRGVADGLRYVSQVSVCVASEGGWSNKELQQAEACRFIPVHLGARILRTETAAIAAVTLAQHLLGDLR
ncbi:MAG TPA: 16S rRNA (uracil(1498)-N(3))-methyltransferase [Blastocatellia bacterium]|nr:16S rRNA (uracil(1498)-N(3))-methyltransferase [Blastocatellia bacterium]